MKKLLIVDDDAHLRRALTEKLNFLSVDVIAAKDGQEALDILEQEPIGLILSDIKMPGIDGIELTRRVKKNKEIPVILMTGFSNIIETQEAYNLGVEEFLTKPLDMGELTKLVRKELDSKAPPRTPDDPHGFCKIGIDDFHYGAQIKHNIYIKLSDSKYIKIAHSGQELSSARISSYKAKGVHYLYIKRDDFFEYVDFGVKLTKLVKKDRSVNLEKKESLIRHVGEVLQERIYQSDLDEEVFESSKVFVQTVVDVMSENPRSFSILKVLNDHSDYLFAHSLGVSIHCVMLSKALGWSLPSNKFKLALAGLYHDIGHKETDRRILEKQRIDWSKEELAEYEEHTVRGHRILQQLDIIPSDVLQIVYQHHENCTGTGFPDKKKKNSIHPMARLVSVSDVFCTKTIKTPQRQSPMRPREAIASILKTSSSEFDPDFLKALMQLYKINPKELDVKKI